MVRNVIFAVLFGVALIAAAAVRPTGAQTPDECTPEHFGYFYLKNFTNNAGGPVMVHHLFNLSADRLVQVQIVFSTGAAAGKQLKFGKADGSTTTIAVTPGMSLVREASSLTAQILGPEWVGSKYFAGCYRFL